MQTQETLLALIALLGKVVLVSGVISALSWLSIRWIYTPEKPASPTVSGEVKILKTEKERRTA